MTLKLKFLFGVVIMTSILFGLGIKSCSEKKNVQDSIENNYDSVLTKGENENIDPKFDYNQKANEVIQQVIIDDSCGCILEIPNKSSIEISLGDNPSFDIRKQAIKELHLKNRTELDSLEKLTSSFILDSSFLKQRNIKVIKQEFLSKMVKDTVSFRACRKGILSISKPIFDKSYTIAIIYYSHAFTCIGTSPRVYRYEKGKWSIK